MVLEMATTRATVQEGILHLLPSSNRVGAVLIYIHQKKKRVSCHIKYEAVDAPKILFYYGQKQHDESIEFHRFYRSHELEIPNIGWNSPPKNTQKCRPVALISTCTQMILPNRTTSNNRHIRVAGQL
jgi:hypothetical protein